MVITNYSDIRATIPEEEVSYKEVAFGDNVIRVLQYLPIQGKSALLQYIIDMALDETTGCFSPIRVNVAYCIGVLRSYCGVHFDDEVNVVDAYDELERNGILDKVMGAIPEEERIYMETLINDTIEDISRYNSSLAGMLQSMQGNANGLDESLRKILEQVKNREGLELLSEIKNVVGTD